MFTRLARLEGQVLPPNWENVLTCLPLQERVRACERRLRSLERRDTAHGDGIERFSAAVQKDAEARERLEVLHEALLSLARKTAASVRTLDARINELERVETRIESKPQTLQAEKEDKSTSDDLKLSIKALQHRLSELEQKIGEPQTQRHHGQIDAQVSERALLPSVSRLDQTLTSLQTQLSDLLQERSRQAQHSDKKSDSEEDWHTRIPLLVRNELRAIGLSDSLESMMERSSARAVQTLREEVRAWLSDKVDREYLEARLGNRPSKASVMQAFQKLRDAVRSEMQALEDRLRQYMEQGQQPAIALERYQQELSELERRCRERSDRAEQTLEELYRRFEPLEERVAATNHEFSSFLLSLRSPAGHGAGLTESSAPRSQPQAENGVASAAREQGAAVDSASGRPETETTPRDTSEGHAVEQRYFCDPDSESRSAPEKNEPLQGDVSALATIEALQIELDKLQQQLEWLACRRIDADHKGSVSHHHADMNEIANDLYVPNQSPEEKRMQRHRGEHHLSPAAPGFSGREGYVTANTNDKDDSGRRQAQQRVVTTRHDTQAVSHSAALDAKASSHLLPDAAASDASEHHRRTTSAQGQGRVTATLHGRQQASLQHTMDGSSVARAPETPSLPSRLQFQEQSSPSDPGGMPDDDSPAHVLDTSTPSAATWYHRRASIANSASKQCEDLERSVLLADPDETLSEVEAAQVLHSIDQFLSEWRNALQERSWARSIEDENSRAIGLALAEVRGYLNAEMCAERGLREAAQRLFDLARTLQNREQGEQERRVA
jgi:hypothetical protein